MIKVIEARSRKGSYNKGKPKKGCYYYALRFRTGTKYFHKYPNRALYTNNPFFKKLYYIDDKIYFFDPETEYEFDEFVYEIVQDLIELIEYYKDKNKEVVVGTMPYFIYQKRLQALETYIEQLLKLTPCYQLLDSVNKLKALKIKLK